MLNLIALILVLIFPMKLMGGLLNAMESFPIQKASSSLGEVDLKEGMKAPWWSQPIVKPHLEGVPLLAITLRKIANLEQSPTYTLQLAELYEGQRRDIASPCFSSSQLPQSFSIPWQYEMLTLFLDKSGDVWIKALPGFSSYHFAVAGDLHLETATILGYLRIAKAANIYNHGTVETVLGIHIQTKGLIDNSAPLKVCNQSSKTQLISHIGDLSLQAQHLNNTSGMIRSSRIYLRLRGAGGSRLGLDNSQGQILGTDALYIFSANEISNYHGIIASSHGKSIIQCFRGICNSSGIMEGQRKLLLQAHDRICNRNGQMRSQGMIKASAAIVTSYNGLWINGKNSHLYGEEKVIIDSEAAFINSYTDTSSFKALSISSNHAFSLASFIGKALKIKGKSSVHFLSSTLASQHVSLNTIKGEIYFSPKTVYGKGVLRLVYHQRPFKLERPMVTRGSLSIKALGVLILNALKVKGTLHIDSQGFNIIFGDQGYPLSEIYTLKDLILKGHWIDITRTGLTIRGAAHIEAFELFTVGKKVNFPDVFTALELRGPHYNLSKGFEFTNARPDGSYLWVKKSLTVTSKQSEIEMASIKSDQDIIWTASDYIHNFGGSLKSQRTITLHTPRFHQSVHHLKSIRGQAIQWPIFDYAYVKADFVAPYRPIIHAGQDLIFKDLEEGNNRGGDLFAGIDIYGDQAIAHYPLHFTFELISSSKIYPTPVPTILDMIHGSWRLEVSCEQAFARACELCPIYSPASLFRPNLDGRLFGQYLAQEGGKPLTQTDEYQNFQGAPNRKRGVPLPSETATPENTLE